MLEYSGCYRSRSQSGHIFRTRGAAIAGARARKVACTGPTCLWEELESETTSWRRLTPRASCAMHTQYPLDKDLPPGI